MSTMTRPDRQPAPEAVADDDGPSVPAIIETEADIDACLALLFVREPRFREAHALTGRPQLRRWPAGYASLLRIVCGQMLSVASAAAAWSRLEAAGVADPARCARLPDDVLLECGLSRGKLRTFRAVTEARIDFDALAGRPDAEVIATLTELPGIGRWTADIYLMFCLGRADVIAAGDLALQEAASHLLGLPARPSDRALRELAQPWAPCRGVAARLLWSYYHLLKGHDGAGDMPGGGTSTTA